MNPLDAINDLERAITKSDDDAETWRWEQARLVSTAVETSTATAVAAGWLNVRTDRPYSFQHVSVVDRVWQRFGSDPDRPPFAEACRIVKSGDRKRSPVDGAIRAIGRLPRQIEPLLGDDLPNLDAYGRLDLRTAINAAIAALSSAREQMAEENWTNDSAPGPDPGGPSTLERPRAEIRDQYALAALAYLSEHPSGQASKGEVARAASTRAHYRTIGGSNAISTHGPYRAIKKLIARGLVIDKDRPDGSRGGWVEITDAGRARAAGTAA